MRATLLLAGGVTLGAVAAPARAQQPAPDTGAIAIQPDNPFLHESPLPLHAPPFDRISNADFRPALEEGMKRQAAEVDAIAAQPPAPHLREHAGGAGEVGADAGAGAAGCSTG